MRDDTPSAATAPLPVASAVTSAEPGDDVIRLTYADRLLRRRRLVSEAGLEFLLDLPETRGVDEGDAFLLADGRRVAVVAAAEPLLDIRGPLTRLAWHIGNRHTPCEIGTDALRIAADHVLAEMLVRLGAEITEVTAPFRPEGGAYGHGRTMGHDHGHSHSHSHG